MYTFLVGRYRKTRLCSEHGNVVLEQRDFVSARSAGDTISLGTNDIITNLISVRKYEKPDNILPPYKCNKVLCLTVVLKNITGQCRLV